MAFDPAAAARNAAERERAAKAIMDVLEAAGEGGHQGLLRAGYVMHAQVVEHLSRHGTGRIYKRGNRIHQASAPGEPPAPDTGKYRASWWVKNGRETPTRWYVEVGTNDERGPWLEYGTRRMDPRPHLRPAVLATLQQITAMVAEHVVEAEKRAAREHGGRG